jgi:hypothetical protein
MIKKTIITFAAIAGIVFLINSGQCSSKENKSSKLEEVAITPSSQPVTPTPQPTETNPGWKTTTGADGYSWVTPEVTNETTSNLVIEDYMATYRIDNTCVQQFIAANGSIVASFKADVENRANYLETPTGSGNFASEPWTKSEHAKAWKDAKWVRFKPVNNEPLNLKVGRAK